jgi:hypothetical protein
LNPAPDADVNSVGRENFEWVVNAVAEMAIKKALSDENPAKDLRWAGFLAGEKPAGNKTMKPASKKKGAAKQA